MRAITILAVAAMALTACGQPAPPPPADEQSLQPSESLDLAELASGRLIAIGVDPAWRLEAERNLGLVFSVTDTDTHRNTVYAEPVRDGDGAMITSEPLTVRVHPQLCRIDSVVYPMTATVELRGDEPLSGCAVMRWDANITALLPAIDACLASATEPMSVIYAARETDSAFVRLTYENETFDCRAPLEAGGTAEVTPADPNTHFAGEREAIFIRAPGDNPGGECYEAPEVRAADGSLLGWWDDPQGC